MKLFLQNEHNIADYDIENIYRQGYDNNANIKGHTSVAHNFLHNNSRTYDK